MILSAVLCLLLPQTDTIRVSTQEVLLDLVVHDRKEKQVRDLKMDEVEIYEDGVRQQTKSFYFVEEGVRTAAGAAPGKLDPTRQINLISLVFEKMNTEGRRLAREAMRDFLAQPLAPNTFVAVFVLDTRLNVVQSFTDDRDLLQKAVARATEGIYVQYVRDSEEILRKLQARDLPGFGAGEPREQRRDAMDHMIERMLKTELAGSHYQLGWMQLGGLLTLVREQGLLPGRKTVLYMSEGLAFPRALENVYRTLVSTANRNNVSFYSMDMRGLRPLAAFSAAASGEARGGAYVSQGEYTGEGSQTKDAAFLNTQMNLAHLADDTGGFLVANSNDMRAPLARVWEQSRSHYELSYVPSSTNYDGHFRKIEVKLGRSGLKVQARSGYYALPFVAGQVLQPFEMGLLNALNATSPPQSVEYKAGVLQFRATPGSVQCAAVFEVPQQTLAAVNRAHFSLMALIKNSDGQVVEKISRDLPLQVPEEKLDAFRRGIFTAVQDFEVPPGRYTVETAVLDRESMKAGTRRTSLIAAPAAGIGLSNVIVVKRLEPIGADWNKFDPLECAHGRVVPSLSGNVQGGPGSQVLLYFIAYPGPGIAAKALARVEFLSDGAVVTSSTMQLPDTDETGAIRYLTATPAERFALGHYDVRVTVQQGQSLAQERTTCDLVAPK